MALAWGVPRCCSQMVAGGGLISKASTLARIAPGLGRLKQVGAGTAGVYRSPHMDVLAWQLQGNQMSYMVTQDSNGLSVSPNNERKARWKPYHLLWSGFRRSLKVASVLIGLGKTGRKICPGLRGGNIGSPQPPVKGGLSKSH